MREISLYLFSSIFIIGVPIYLFLRSKMNSNKYDFDEFNKKTVLKVTFIIFLLNLISLVFVYYHYYFIFNETKFYLTKIFTIIIIIFLASAFFGAGMYVTSIVIKSFSLPKLQKNKEYKIQSIAEKLFHGILGHTFVFLSWITVFSLLGYFEFSNNIIFIDNNLFLIIAGFILGIGLSLSQIIVDTYFYTFIGVVLQFFIFFILVNITRANIFSMIMPSYMYGFYFGAILTDLLFFIYLIITKQNIHFDREKY